MIFFAILFHVDTCGSIHQHVFWLGSSIILAFCCLFIWVRIHFSYVQYIEEEDFAKENQKEEQNRESKERDGNVVEGYGEEKVSRLSENDSKNVVDKKSSRVRLHLFPFYFKVLKVLCGILLFRSFILSFENPHSRTYGLITVSIINPLSAIVSESVPFFMIQNSVGRDSIRNTILFCIIWGCSLGVFGYAMWESNDTTGTTANFVKTSTTLYWVIFDGIRVLYYVVIWFIILSRGKLPYLGSGRTSPMIYSSVNMIFYVAISIGDAILAFDIAASECYLFILGGIWTILFPFLAYYTLVLDSLFWRRVGKDDFSKLSEKEDIKDSAFAENKTAKILFCPSFCERKKYDSRSGLEEKLLQPMNLHGRTYKYPSKFVLDFENIRFGKRISEGGSASVFVGLFKSENKIVEVAIKKFKVSSLTEDFIKDFTLEAYLSTSLAHENIIRSYGVSVLPPSVCLVYELMERGSLFNVLKLVREGIFKVTKDILIGFAKDIAKGLLCLHTQSPPIIHRDLKSLNILVSKDWMCKIADLGEARYFGYESSFEKKEEVFMTQGRGTPQWMAPEMFTTSDYNEKVDIFSFGIILWEIGSLCPPFENENPWLIPAAICGNVRPGIEKVKIEELKAIIEECWDGDPNKRPKIAIILEKLEAL